MKLKKTYNEDYSYSGSSQTMRFPEALHPSYVKVDERSESELMAFGSEFGKLAYFYNLQDRKDGDWSIFFESDYRMAVAIIANSNYYDENLRLQSYEKALLSIIEDIRLLASNFESVEDMVTSITEEEREMLEEAKQVLLNIFDLTYAISDKENQWIDFIYSFTPNNEFEEYFQQLIILSLGPNLIEIISYQIALSGVNLVAPVNFNRFANYNSLWQLSTNISPANLTVFLTPAEKQAWEDSGEPFEVWFVNWFKDDPDQAAAFAGRVWTQGLQVQIARFFKSYVELIGRAQQEMQQLTFEGDMNPDLSLYLAFLRLMQRPLDHINQITARHLNFYYRKVLGLDMKAAIPDEVFVYFEPTEETTAYQLPVNTLLDAGQNDDGETLTFKTLFSTIITQVEVEQAYTIFLGNTNREVLPFKTTFATCNSAFKAQDHPPIQLLEHVGNDFVVSDVEVTDIFELPFFQVIETPTEGQLKLDNSYMSWPTFGRQPEINETLEIGNIGLAVSAPELVLREGKRRAKLNFKVTQDSAEALIHFIESHAGFPLQTGCANDDQEFLIFPQENFLVDVTTLEGWQELKASEFVVQFSIKELTLQLCIEVDSGFAGIDSVDEEVAEDSSEPLYFNTWPTVRLRLNNHPHALDESLYFYLKNLVVQEIEIKVRVWGVKGLTIYNDTSQLEPSESFEPFGPIAELGNSFYFGNQELFLKNSQVSSLKLTYQGLPVDGFCQYYLAYTNYLNQKTQQITIANDSFKGYFWQLVDGRWKRDGIANPIIVEPLEPPHTLYDLFISSSGDGGEDGVSSVETDEIDFCIGETGFGTETVVTTCPQNLVATANYSVPNPPVYDATAQSGFFRFEFVKPDTLGFGFGERYYADVLNQVTLENTVTAGLLVKDGKDGNGGDGDEDPANGDNPEAPEKKDRKGPLGFIIKLVVGIIRLFKKKSKSETQANANESAVEEGDAAMTSDAADLDGEDPVVPEDDFLPLPNPPFVPLAKSVAVDYNASAKINLAVPDQVTNANGIQFYYITPFTSFNAGLAFSEKQKVLPVNGANKTELQPSTPYFFPRYTNQGNLFLQLTSVLPDQPVAFLFELVETEMSQLVDNFPQVTYSYLSESGWKTLASDQILTDSTSNFLCSGIVSLYLPQDITDQSELMPTGAYWIALTVPHNVQLLDWTVQLNPNAVRAVRVVDEEGADIDTQPSKDIEKIEPDTITALVVENPNIQSVFQPFGSFGGRPAEDETTFRERVSERLRHKQRAITPWDYERIILERFPSIFNVRAYNHTNMPVQWLPERGVVRIVVVPLIVGPGAEPARYEPKASVCLLQEIREYVRQFAPPYAKILVENPAFEPLCIRCHVLFRSGLDLGETENMLYYDLKNYLSPWIVDNGLIPNDTFMLPRKSKILEFMQSLPYVEQITDFDVAVPPILLLGQPKAAPAITSDRLLGTTPWNILMLKDKSNLNLTVLNGKVQV